MKEVYLMTMDLNGINPTNHGRVTIDSSNYLHDKVIAGGENYYDGTPVEDYGFFYYSEKPFPTNEEWMFNKFLSLMEA